MDLGKEGLASIFVICRRVWEVFCIVRRIFGRDFGEFRVVFLESEGLGKLFVFGGNIEGGRGFIVLWVSVFFLF